MSTEMKFPDGFYWGAATSAFQVEGGITGMDWDDASHDGRVPKIGKAADHYTLYEKDFDLAKELGHNAHRFSVEWARIEPEEGKFDMREIEHYRAVLGALHARGITPFVTLWHFSLPSWFAESGGFERADAPVLFARYASFVVEHLSDQCEHFATINEPNVFAGHGWLYGAWPPFKRGSIFFKKLGKPDGTWQSATSTSFKNVLTYFKVVSNLASAHSLAYDEIKKVAPTVTVSIVKHVRAFESNKNPLNYIRARISEYAQSGHFMNRVHAKCDAVCLNYYRRTKYGDTKEYPTTDMGWHIHPESIETAIMYLWRTYRKPIYISEAGIADAADRLRADYIKGQVVGTWRAIERGADVRAHMYWSLLDNYELALGYEKRFGLIEIDYETRMRRVRPSAHVYKKICQNNGLTLDD